MASVEAPSSLPCSETSRRRYSDTAVQPCFRKEKIEEMKKRVSVSKFLVIGRLEAKKNPEKSRGKNKDNFFTFSGQHVKHCVLAEHCWFFATYSLQSSETKPDLAP